MEMTNKIEIIEQEQHKIKKKLEPELIFSSKKIPRKWIL